VKFPRSSFLDNMAGMQAQVMASYCRVEHSADNIQELQSRLRSKCVGENVQCGKSERAMMAAQSDVLRKNVLGNFTQFGVGAARGTDGKLYLCQLFRSA